VEFEWNPEKAASNFGEHSASFEEASSVFGDPLATTVPDPDRSAGEERFLTTGLSNRQRVLIVWHTERGDVIRIIGAREATPPVSGGSMSQGSRPEPEEMRPEYDIRGGVRGKYYERYRQGTNVVLLEPDVAAVFHDSDSVNRALRMLIDVARSQASAGSGDESH